MRVRITHAVGRKGENAKPIVSMGREMDELYGRIATSSAQSAQRSALMRNAMVFCHSGTNRLDEAAGARMNNIRLQLGNPFLIAIYSLALLLIGAAIGARWGCNPAVMDAQLPRLPGVQERTKTSRRR